MRGVEGEVARGRALGGQREGLLVGRLAEIAHESHQRVVELVLLPLGVETLQKVAELLVPDRDRVDVGVGRAVAVDAAAVAEQLEEGG